MDAFVTGGSGFVGTHLLERLESEDGIDAVRALARSKESARAVEACGATAVRGDLSDLESMIDGMCDCDTVFHLAAKADRWGPHENFAEVNVRGTENVVQAAREAGVETLVHTSTEAVLADGTPLRNVDETTRYPDDPIIRYPETKGEAKKECSTETTRNPRPSLSDRVSSGDRATEHSCPSSPPLDRLTLAIAGHEVTADDTKAREELGYEPVVTREEGLKELREPSPEEFAVV